MACSTGCFAMACSTGCSVLMKSMCENSWVHLLDSAGCLFSIGHGAGNLHMCHLAEKGVKVVMPLVLWVQYTGARTWFKGYAICCSVSCHTQCLGPVESKENMWMMHTSSPWKDKKQTTMPASNGGLAVHCSKTASPRLQVALCWILAEKDVHMSWACEAAWGQIARPYGQSFLGALVGSSRPMDMSNGLEMDSSLASNSSMMDLSMAVVFWMAAASCPTTLFFLSMEKQFGKMPWFAKLEATCNSQWCFLIIGQPRSFQVARHFSTCLAKASGVAKWCQVAWNNSTKCTKSWKQWAAALWAVSSALMASKKWSSSGSKVNNSEAVQENLEDFLCLSTLFC